MHLRSVLFPLCAAAAAAGCSMPSGESERQEAAKIEAAERAAAAHAADHGKAGAAGKAEEGRLSIKAPGVDIAIAVPDAMRGRAGVDANSEVLPPGAQVSGVHVQGDGGDRTQGRDSVELRFVAAEPVDRVAAWYRDPARREHFTIGEARREGAAVVLAGTNADGAPISVRLTPREGGTDGRLVLVDRD
ncbi:MAG TPA: hypothetical protein VGB08_06740 [Allosphingosinicella sp.]|jgi:hypothetical protein